MFSLPQVEQRIDGLSADGAPAVIPVTETSKVIDDLLRLVYPVEKPSLNDMEEVAAILLAGRKYQMTDAVMITARSAFTSKFISTNPLQMFIWSCRLDMEEEARLAAYYLLRGDMGEQRAHLLSYRDVTGLEDITAGAYFRLLWSLNNRAWETLKGDFRFIRRWHSDDGVQSVAAPR